MDSTPKICYVCSRLCYLRCFDCDTVYCSTKCKIDDWEDHEIRMKDTKKKNMSVKINKTSVAFKMMEKYFTKNVKEGGHVSVQDRLKKATRAEEVAAKSEFDVSKVKKEPEDETEFKAYFDYSEFAEEILLAQSQVKREFKAIVWSSDEEEL